MQVQCTAKTQHQANGEQQSGGWSTEKRSGQGLGVNQRSSNHASAPGVPAAAKYLWWSRSACDLSDVQEQALSRWRGMFEMWRRLGYFCPSLMNAEKLNAGSRAPSCVHRAHGLLFILHLHSPPPNIQHKVCFSPGLFYYCPFWNMTQLHHTLE